MLSKSHYSYFLSIVLALAVFHGRSPAACFALKMPDRTPVRENKDPLARLLAANERCPVDVFELRTAILKGGGQLNTSLVGNRGFHNPGAGSFSLFETVLGRSDAAIGSVEPGEFFFGHFTGAAPGRKLIANQSAEEGNLMVELIAFDRQKGIFNFYEVIGDGKKGIWFYRGDSLDIFADITSLHRQTDPTRPQFGNRLRCSGCHMGGGPILKELALPHNDWSTQVRPLAFGALSPDSFLAGVFRDLKDAEELAKNVRAGMSLLEQSPALQKARKAFTLQEQLRPLFCPVELNLESDSSPLEDRKPSIQIPSAFFVNTRLAQGEVTAARADYEGALAATMTRFPEISRADADHAWLTPVKASTDLGAIDSLIQQHIVDEEFVSDVLAVDFTNPVFSPARCNLLRFVPAAGDLLPGFRKALAASSLPEAKELLGNLDDPKRSAGFHKAQAQELLSACNKVTKTKAGLIDLYKLLAQRRAEAFASEISKNRNGQILEPGFRVIFPQVTPKATPGRLRLTAACLLQ